jgi:DNA-binding transcriptional ArsR family regulator
MELIRRQAELCGLFSDEHRLLMVYALAEKAHSVGQLAARISLSQPSTSRHLKMLRQGGVVMVKRQGKLMYYSLSDPRFLDSLSLLRLIVADQMKRQSPWISPNDSPAIPPMSPFDDSGHQENR